jgi:hypothetical protein
MFVAFTKSPRMVKEFLSINTRAALTTTVILKKLEVIGQHAGHVPDVEAR